MVVKCRVAVEDFGRVQPAGFKLFCEFHAHQHAAQFGEQHGAGAEQNEFGARGVDQLARRAVPQET